MAKRPPPRDSSRAIFTALIAFGLFALGVKFFPTSSAPRASAVPPPPPTRSLVEITPDGAFDFSQLELTFDPTATESAPSTVHRPIRPEQLIDLLVSQDTLTATDRDRVIQVVRNKLDQVTDPESRPPTAPGLKKAADTLLVNLGPAGSVPAYNRLSHSLSAIVRHGTWQCSSGTLVFSLVALRQPPSTLLDLNLVQIFERGHVLPGFMQWRNGEWHLYGLETTVRGTGLKTYGATATLGARGFALRVVAMPEAWIATALTPTATNAEAVALKLLRETATRYDLPLRELEGNLQATGATVISAESSARNPKSRVRAMWAFGESSAPSGDLPFAVVNEIPLIDNPMPYTEVLALEAATKTLTVILEDASDSSSASGGH